MSKITLDKNKPHAVIYGDDKGRVYAQGDHHFRTDGSLWRDPDVKESAAEKKAREEAEAAEAKRIADEEAAAKKALAEGATADEQLSKQLSTGSVTGAA